MELDELQLHATLSSWTLDILSWTKEASYKMIQLAYFHTNIFHTTEQSIFLIYFYLQKVKNQEKVMLGIHNWKLKYKQSKEAMTIKLG